MSFPDPFTVAATAPWPALVMRVVPPALPKGNGLNRMDATGQFLMTITHDRDKRTGERHVFRITETKDVTSPSGAISKQSAFIAVTFQAPPIGWDAAQKAAFWPGLKAAIDDAEVTWALFLQDQS